MNSRKGSANYPNWNFIIIKAPNDSAGHERKKFGSVDNFGDECFLLLSWPQRQFGRVVSFYHADIQAMNCWKKPDKKSWRKILYLPWIRHPKGCIEIQRIYASEQKKTLFVLICLFSKIFQRIEFSRKMFQKFYLGKNRICSEIGLMEILPFVGTLFAQTIILSIWIQNANKTLTIKS